MAIDKAIDSSALNSNLTSIANAIRTKGGTSAPLAFPAGFVSAIGNIPTGTPVQTYSGTFRTDADGYLRRTAASSPISCMYTSGHFIMIIHSHPILPFRFSSRLLNRVYTMLLITKTCSFLTAT